MIMAGHLQGQEQLVDSFGRVGRSVRIVGRGGGEATVDCVVEVWLAHVASLRNARVVEGRGEFRFAILPMGTDSSDTSFMDFVDPILTQVLGSRRLRGGSSTDRARPGPYPR